MTPEIQSIKEKNSQTTEEFLRGLSGNKIKSFIVQRKATVSLVTDVIRCAHSLTALITTDELTDYESILRQTSRDGMITGVDFVKLDGAIVTMINSSGEEEIYDFDEDELEEIKASFGLG